MATSRRSRAGSILQPTLSLSYLTMIQVLCVVAICALAAAVEEQANSEPANVPTAGAAATLEPKTVDARFEGDSITAHNSVKNNTLLQLDCSLNDIILSQYFQGFAFDGQPIFGVQIINLCSASKCKICKIHVSCGMFSSGVPVDPHRFRRLQPGDCLVNDGLSMQSDDVIYFVYSNIRMTPMHVMSGKVHDC